MAYYLKFIERIQAPMCSFFNSLASAEHLPQGALLAHITVLPKEGKDRTLPQSYRLISLLNTDLKLFAKILANHLKNLHP